MSRRDLDSILNEVDEPEETPDVPETMEREALPVTEEPEPEVSEEPTPESSQEAEPTQTEGGDGDGEEQKGLPPWMHARLKAKEDKIAALEARLQQQAQVQPPAQQQQPDPTMSVQSYVDQQTAAIEAKVQEQLLIANNRQTAVLLAQQHGQEQVDQAVAWARDRQAADPAFRQAAISSGSPIEFAMREFQREQVNQELARYGGDLDKLVEAKMAERLSQGQAEEPVPQQQSSQLGSMPADFSKTSSKRGSGRTATFVGPTPLSKLLDS